MMEKFFSFMSFYEQHQQGAPTQSNNSNNNNNVTPMSLDGSSYARGNQQQQPTFAPYEPQRGSVSFMPQPAPGQERTLDALQIQSQFAHVLKLQTTKPFDGKDFFTWSFEFEQMMEGAQILGFFDGSLPYPTNGTQYEKQQYIYQSMMAYTILLRNITPTQQQNIRSYRGYGNSAELAYNHLKSLYQATDSVSQSRLMAQLTTVEMKPGEKGMAYISRCRELRDKLLRCGGSISEDAFVTVIIGGLGPQWRATNVRGPLSEGLGFESQCVHFGHLSAGGCQRSTGDSRLILGKGYRLIVLGGYGRIDPLLNKPFYPNESPKQRSAPKSTPINKTWTCKKTDIKGRHQHRNLRFILSDTTTTTTIGINNRS
ncbi:unnamed protein product [Closterium sp. NIES-54]